MRWNPHVYLQFAAPRTRPAADLLARIPNNNPRRFVDLGCGRAIPTALAVRHRPGTFLHALDAYKAWLNKACPRLFGVALKA